MTSSIASSSRRFALLIGVCACFGIGSAEAAEYSFGAEPSYPPDRAREIYQPLMTYLQKTTGQTFKLVTARNYHFYWRDIHATAKTDFAFDEAHFTDYRIT